MLEEGIYKLHESLKSKKVSAVELVKDAISQREHHQTNSYISDTSELALEQALRADKNIKKEGPKSYLHGIPYSLKDLFVTKGIRTTAGSKILYNYIPPFDGFISKSLKESGAILMGKVSCDEFGMGSSNENTCFGPVIHPHQKEYVAGGSSGGSAASVLEGSSAFSMGTDTGGSVRLPAYFCGLTGLKPTYGRVSRYGQIAFASSLDQASPIGRSVLDVACILPSITTKDHRDSTNVPLPPCDPVSSLLNLSSDFLKGKVIGYSEDFIKGCDSSVEKNLREAMDLLKKMGVTFKEIQLPHAKYAVSVYYIVACSEASANLARFDGIHYGLRDHSADTIIDTYEKSRGEGFGDEVKKRILLGTFALSSGYYDEYFRKASKVRHLIYQDFSNAFSECDVYFSPVCTSTAFKKGEKTKDSLNMYLTDMFTIPASLAGAPAISVPFGQDEKNLPTGLQLIGKWFQEEELLKFAHAFYRETHK